MAIPHIKSVMKVLEDLFSEYEYKPFDDGILRGIHKRNGKKIILNDTKAIQRIAERKFNESGSTKDRFIQKQTLFVEKYKSWLPNYLTDAVQEKYFDALTKYLKAVEKVGKRSTDRMEFKDLFIDNHFDDFDRMVERAKSELGWKIEKHNGIAKYTLALWFTAVSKTWIIDVFPTSFCRLFVELYNRETIGKTAISNARKNKVEQKELRSELKRLLAER